MFLSSFLSLFLFFFFQSAKTLQFGISLLNPEISYATQWHALAGPVTHQFWPGRLSTVPLWAAMLRDMLSPVTTQNILRDCATITDLVCLCDQKSHSDRNQTQGIRKAAMCYPYHPGGAEHASVSET